MIGVVVVVILVCFCVCFFCCSQVRQYKKFQNELKAIERNRVDSEDQAPSTIDSLGDKEFIGKEIGPEVNSFVMRAAANDTISSAGRPNSVSIVDSICKPEVMEVKNDLLKSSFVSRRPRNPSDNFDNPLLTSGRSKANMLELLDTQGNEIDL